MRCDHCNEPLTGCGHVVRFCSEACQGFYRLARGEDHAAAMTFAAIGQELGVSSSRAEQICRTGLSKLRRDASLRELWS
jgi:hypothetical protein